MTTYLKRLLLSGLVAIIMVIGIIHLPSVQHALFTKFFSHLTHTTNYSFTHKKFRFTWLQQLTIEDIEVKDAQKKVLFHINHLNCVLNPLQSLISSTIDLASIKIDGVQLNLEHDEAEKLNLELFVKELFPSSTGGAFFIKNAALQGLNCALNNTTIGWLPSLIGQVQCNNIEGEFHRVRMNKAMFSVGIDKLTCMDSESPLHLCSLSTAFKIASHICQLQQLKLTTASSTLQGDFSLSSNGPALTNIVGLQGDHIHMQVVLREAKLSSQDLGFFFPHLKQKDAFFKIGGTISGNLKTLITENLAFQFGKKGSYFRGKDKGKCLGEMSAKMMI